MIIRASAIASILILLAASAVAAAPRERTSTVAQRDFVNLTVYNGGTALVHDQRRVFLANGVNRIAWRDVSAEMDPTTALVDAIGGSGGVSVVEQNFDFDLFNPSALLSKYIGKSVIVVHDPRFAGERETRERAKLLSTEGGIVLQYHDRIETELRGHIAFPVSSSSFRDRPTLVLELGSSRSAFRTLDLSYLTSGMSWHADYVGVLNADDNRLGLTGLITMSNTSGESYENASLQLIAGNVSMVPLQTMRAAGTLVQPGTIADVYQTSKFEQENYFEYHLYRLTHPTTILDKQTKQIALLSAHDVPVTKTLELRGGGDYYRNEDADLGDRLPVEVYVTFENRGGDLGIPLPAGALRLYKKDSHNVSQFAGSDQISHTPKGETVRLNLGNSFDVTARKRQTDFTAVNDCTGQSSYEIVVSNAKAIAQDVLVVEPIPGDWEILRENLPHVKSSAFTANWHVHVPPEGRYKLMYTAKSSWC